MLLQLLGYQLMKIVPVLLGCNDMMATNYNELAVANDGSCEYPTSETCTDEVNAAYESGFDAGAASITPEDGISQADVDFAVAEAASEILALEAQLADALADCDDDGIGQADVDAAIAEAASEILALEAQLADALANCDDDGIGQADVDAAIAEAASEILALEAQLADALANCDDDGIGQADVDAAYANGVASVVCDPNAGYDIGYSDGAASVDITVDNQESFDAGVASVDITVDNLAISDEAYGWGYGDGLASAQADLDALQVLLDEAIANSGNGSCEPIYIDLIEGWNIIGYTLPIPQDVTATLAPIVSNVQIVKKIMQLRYIGQKYFFNGIGDFIPGQGYQIRMSSAIDNYTLPDVGGQRIELSPSVPEWVHELPVLNHPNDIRSLVRVVNMLGQEVDPNTQFKGEILLYLYNDGTTEKHIVN